VNSLPKTVTRQRRDWDLNPGPSAPESSTLTTRLQSHKVGEKSHSFPGFSRAINLPFHRLSQQKVNVIMTFIKGHSTSTPVPSILADIYWAESLLPEIVMILFTQSTAVLHKHLNDELKTTLLQFFLRQHRIP